MLNHIYLVMANLVVADWIIFCGYLVAVFLLGLVFAARQQTNEDYFLGRRRMNWFAVGLSLFATAFSSLSFVMLPREGAYEDYHLMVALLFIPLVITPVLWWLFVPLYLRLQVTSVYEYLEIRFDRGLRRLGTLLFACYAIGWMGTMLYAVGLILQVVMGLDDAQLVWTVIGLGLFATLYTTAGGVQAVVWTDVLQAVTLGGGMLVVFAFAVCRVEGGLEAVVRIGVEHNKFAMFNMDFQLAERASFWSACAFGLFMYLPGYTTSQVTVQRYLCTANLGEARRALAINAVVATLVSVLFFMVGTTLFAFYDQAGGFPDLPKQEQILPYFVATQLPNLGITGLLIAGLFAAAMSTIDSGINSLTAVVVYDWLSGRNLSVGVSRLLCAAFGIGLVMAALIVPYLQERLIGIITTIAGTFLGLLLGVFLLGMFVRRANGGGVFIGLLFGAACLAFVWRATDIPHWWYGAFACFPTFLAGWLASYAFPPPRPEQLRGLVSRGGFGAAGSGGIRGDH